MKVKKVKKSLFIALLIITLNIIAVPLASAADPTVSVNGNAGFTPAGFSGTGAPGDPYILENKNIDASSANGIDIENTDAYFVIKNCTVYDGGSSFDGIYLENVTHGRIENCTVYNNTVGIYLYLSSNYNNITGNTAYNNTAGIVLSTSSNNSTLTSNTVYNNIAGIVLSTSCDNTLIGNTAHNNTLYGIFLYTNCDNNTLTGNTACNNTNIGIVLSTGCNNNTLIGNTACNNTYYGIVLSTSCNNNTLNDTYVHNMVWDFASDGTCADNVAYNFHISCYPTNISFTYGNGIALVGVPIGSLPPTPLGLKGIRMYVNATNATATSWILLNISYADPDVLGVYEETLMIYRWNGTAWVPADGSGVNGVNTAENYAYANITEFSNFGVLGKAIPPVGGFVLPAEFPSYSVMFIIVAIAASAAATIFARRKLQP